MAVYSVHHKTTYRYKRPIRPGPHQLLFRPRDSFDQHLLDCRLGVIPEPSEIRWIHDVFGNCLTLVDFNTKCELLEFETFIRLEHTPENAPDFRIEDYARSHPLSYSDDEAPDLAAYIRRHHPQDTEVEEMVRKVRSERRQPTHRSAAIGVHSGLACGAATDLPSAFVAVRHGGGSDDKVILGDGRPVPTIVFHGRSRHYGASKQRRSYP